MRAKGNVIIRLRLVLAVLLCFHSSTWAQSGLRHLNAPSSLRDGAAGAEVPNPARTGQVDRLFDQLSRSFPRESPRNESLSPESLSPESLPRAYSVAQFTASTGHGGESERLLQEFLFQGARTWTDRQAVGGSLQILLMVSVLSLAPAILLMTTCYVRIVVVLGLLRQALGTGQLPPTQVITSIALFMTLFVMAPVWSRIYRESIQPYTADNSTMSEEEAWSAGIIPVREFMSRQIDMAGNEDDVHLFYSYHNGGGTPAASWEEIPLPVLLPAYMLSELKTAFLMGFMIFLPFLVIDLVVASVTISMGMMMLPPAMISLPFKLLLFVLVDGWHLVVEMLLKSFGTLN